MESVHAKVLVADDEPHLLRLVKFRLEREGYEVLTACDGEAALKVVREEKPDLCVLDVICLLYTSPSPRDTERSRMPSSA